MKNKGIIIVVVIVLLLGGGYFLLRGKSVGPVTSPGTTTSGISSGMKSIKDLIAAGVPQKCTYSTNDQSGGSTSGTSYISGGKVRGDFTSTASGKATVSHMISDGTTSYVWTDGQKEGFKMTVSQSEANASSAPAAAGGAGSSQGSAADLNQQANYSCSAWIPDSSVFTPPTNITFTDFSQMLKFTPPPTVQGVPPANAPQIPSGY